MAGNFQYLIPTGELSIASQTDMRMKAEQQGRLTLKDKAVVNDVSQAVARPFDYPNDFVPAATRAGLSGWLSAPFVAAATPYSVFADNTGAALTPQVPATAVWVFFGVAVLTLNDPCTQLFFALGTAANRKAQFDLEILYTKLETSGYFARPVVYEPQDIVTCTVRSRIALGAAVGCRVVLWGYVVERLQENLS